MIIIDGGEVYDYRLEQLIGEGSEEVITYDEHKSAILIKWV